jgi:large subunit ribosomal protein L6
LSRLGKKPITVPAGVEVKAVNGLVTVKGPKGELSQEIFSGYSVVVEDSLVTVKTDSDERSAMAKWGLLAVLVKNMVLGVSEGFQKALIVEGVGYRVQLQGKKLTIIAGYSHPILYIAPEGIDFVVEGTNKVIVSGIDKQKVGQVAAEIRGIRPPEPYKGKGIRYDGEYIARKAGKTNA